MAPAITSLAWCALRAVIKQNYRIPELPEFSHSQALFRCQMTSMDKTPSADLLGRHKYKSLIF